jgi:translation initiation factor 1
LPFSCSHPNVKYQYLRQSRQFACNGTIVQDEKSGDVIQLQGDQRNAVKDFLVDQGGLELDPKTIKVHGF